MTTSRSKTLRSTRNTAKRSRRDVRGSKTGTQLCLYSYSTSRRPLFTSTTRTRWELLRTRSSWKKWSTRSKKQLNRSSRRRTSFTSRDSSAMERHLKRRSSRRCQASTNQWWSWEMPPKFWARRPWDYSRNSVSLFGSNVDSTDLLSL